MTKKVAIPAMLSDLIQAGLTDIDGCSFTGAGKCPVCGADLKGHDFRKKLFAKIVEHGEEREITVNIKRYKCISCGKLVYAKSPFYENTRIGSPITDFCIVNRSLHPANHIAKVLNTLKISITPATVRNLQKVEAQPPYITFFDVNYPLSLLKLSDEIADKRDILNTHSDTPAFSAEDLLKR